MRFVPDFLTALAVSRAGTGVFTAALFILMSIRPDSCGSGADGQLAPAAQPDGTVIQLRNCGGEWFHWHETDDGFVVARDADGFWKYAVPEPGSAKLKPVREAIVGRIAPRSLGLKRHGLPKAREIHREIRRLQGSRSANEHSAGLVIKNHVAKTRGEISEQSAVSFGTRKVRCIVILAGFSNHWDAARGTVSTNYGLPRGNYDLLCNQLGYNADGAKGSVRDFYLENSYGKLAIDFAVTDWVRLPQSESWYGDNANEVDGEGRTRQMAIDAVNAASAAGFDFSTGDGDGDGYVDLLHVIHSGYSEAVSGNPSSYLWPHEWWMPNGRMVVNGIGISTFSYSSALRGKKAVPARLARIGQMCHELGHQFGLPDLYDAGLETQGVGTWCTMGYGNWGAGPTGDGVLPVQFSARCKQLLGFVTPEVVHSGDLMGLARVEDHPAIHLIRDGFPDKHEYLLVENRQPAGFDSQLPGGILIWHVRDDFYNNNTGETEHPAVRLEEASGRDNLSTNRYAAANQTWRFGNGLAGGFRDATGRPDCNAMAYQSGSQYERSDDSTSYSFIHLNGFSTNGATMTYSLQTVVPTVRATAVASGQTRASWSTASEAVQYELQRGVLVTNTSFSDGAEDAEAIFDLWKTTGVVHRSRDDAKSGSYSYCFSTLTEEGLRNYSRAQTLELRQPFVVTDQTELAFWAMSHLSEGRGFLRAEVSTDGGETWMPLFELTGYVDPWSETTLNAVDFELAGVSPGDQCRLRFLARIQDVWGWDGYPERGFALDDIRLSGIKMSAPDEWQTVADDISGNELTAGSDPAQLTEFRMRALVDGQWRAWSRPVSSLAGYDLWAEGLPPGLRDERSDADDDGVPNVIEYALGTDGSSAAGAEGTQMPFAALQTTTGSAQFALTISLPANPPEDIRYTVETASDLKTGWTGIAVKDGTDSWSEPASVASRAVVNGRQTFIIVESVQAGNSPHFFRLEISRKQ